MIRFIGITFILLWLLLLIGSIFLSSCAVVSYCNGQYLGFAIDSILSILSFRNVIKEVNQFPTYFYYIIHNRYEHDSWQEMMVYNGRKQHKDEEHK